MHQLIDHVHSLPPIAFAKRRSCVCVMGFIAVNNVFVCCCRCYVRQFLFNLPIIIGKSVFPLKVLQVFQKI